MMDLSQVSLQTWETLRDSITLAQTIEDMSVERLTTIAKEFADGLPIDSPVTALIDGLVDRINQLDSLTDHIISTSLTELDRLRAENAQLREVYQPWIDAINATALERGDTQET